MLLLACILGGLGLLVLLLLFTPAWLKIDYLYDNKVHTLRSHVRLFLIPVSFKVNLFKKKKKSGDNQLTPKRFIAFSEALYDCCREAVPELSSVIKELNKHFTCPVFTLTMQYGTSNPAVTGTLNGAVWTGATLILKVLDEIFGVRKKNLQISPDFQHECMCLHIKGTFRFMLLHGLRMRDQIKHLTDGVKSHFVYSEENRQTSENCEAI